MLTVIPTRPHSPSSRSSPSERELSSETQSSGERGDQLRKRAQVSGLPGLALPPPSPQSPSGSARCVFNPLPGVNLLLEIEKSQKLEARSQEIRFSSWLTLVLQP